MALYHKSNLDILSLYFVAKVPTQKIDLKIFLRTFCEYHQEVEENSEETLKFSGQVQSPTRGLHYKTFYGHNLRIFAIR
jgi:hypothetical protein